MTPFQYRARCRRVVDGDTFELVLDLGFHLTFAERFRLLDVDAYEVHDKDPAKRKMAAEGTALARERLVRDGEEWPLMVETARSKDNFGRWLCRITTPEGVDFGGLLIARELAVPFVR